MANKKTNLDVRDYVHLHNHTQYSLLDGLTKVPDLMKQVKSYGMTAVAMTDHGTMGGAIEFYKEALAGDIKPIIGIETYIAARGHLDKEPGKDKNNFHLTVLAMNGTGYRNLMALSSIANLSGFYYRPRIDHELLEKYHEGLIILSGCMGGEIGDSLKQGQYEAAKEIATWYKHLLGDRYYLEVQDHGHPDHPSHFAEQKVINDQILRLAEELDIPAVVTCDAHYLRHEDQEAHEILLCVQTGSFLSDEKRMSLKNIELHLTDPQEIIRRWGADHPELILHTSEIASRCDLTIELEKILIPKFPVPAGDDEQSFLQKQVYQGLSWRYGGVAEAKAHKLDVAAAQKTLPTHVLERAQYELGVIAEMGFNGYFLIIADFINWGKAQGIMFGPGRGSAAGSIIAYALKITELDPLAYDLLFERFLNPDRISMPDVDIDIQDTRREEVIQYCVNKYGSERVANIVTFGRMAARNAVRDVARVLQVPYADADRLAKMIPPPVQGLHVPLSAAIAQDQALKQEYETNATATRVFDLAMQVEGTIRSHGVHAAGVVIAPENIVNYAPLEMAQKGVVATQYPMGPIEELGLLKMDFLGLSNLTIIKNALRIIKRVYGKDIAIAEIPLDDNATFELLRHGDTTGVFQLESAGMKRYLQDLEPTTFEDIVAMNALYRPGPMQFIEDFIARKRGRRPISYPHPSMENALKNTYGVMVYQEQVMQISKEVCGFSGGEADTLRKAIGKKKIDMMRKMKARMIEGGQKISGIPPVVMEKFWQQLEDFAAYCFNKSHSACYAMIAYQTAYLKAHYPAAFMAALMTSDYDDTDRLAIEITECRKMGISVLPPDVNESFLEFAVVPDKANPLNPKLPIRFGMNAIKNVGTGAVEEILRAREQLGTFQDLGMFFQKVNCHIVNRKALESLVKAGAFDRFATRSTMLFNLDRIVAFAGRFQKQASSGQTDLFGNEISSAENTASAVLGLQPAPQSVDKREELVWERELLGLYLSQHPLAPFAGILREKAVPIKELKVEHEGQSITIGGAINAIREVVTKNGQRMAFVKIEDESSELEAIIFPSVYEQLSEGLVRDNIVLIKGKVNARGRDGSVGEIKVIVDDLSEITPAQAETYTPTGKEAKRPLARQTAASAAGPGAKAINKPALNRLYIRLMNEHDETLLLSLKQTLDAYSGSTDVVLILGDQEQRQAIKLPIGIDPDSAGIDSLTELVGADNIKLG